MLCNNHFDELIIFDGTRLYSPLIEGRTLMIRAENLVLSQHHPLSRNGVETTFEQGVMIFNGIVKSVRMIYEYRSDPLTSNFSPAYNICDFSSEAGSREVKRYEFDGILVTPFAHVDWEILAESFALKIITD